MSKRKFWIPGYLTEEVSATDQGSIWNATLIRSGWSRNGLYYPRPTLQEAAPLFEGSPVEYYAAGTPVTHIPRAKRLAGVSAPAGNIAGVSANCAAIESGGRLELQAQIHITQQPIREELANHWRVFQKYGIPMALGLSIDGNAALRMGTAEGRKGLIVDRIFEILGTAIVSQPAAGGRFSQLVAGFSQIKEDHMKPLLAWLRAKGHTVKSQEPAEVCQQVISIIQEDVGDASWMQLALDLLSAGKLEEVQGLLELAISSQNSSTVMEAVAVQAPAPSASSTLSRVEADLATIRRQAQRATEIAEGVQLSSSAAELERQLSSSDLPEKMARFVRKQFEGKVFEAKVLAEAISEIQESIGSPPPATGVLQGRAADIRLGVGEIERQQAGWDIVMGYDYTKDKERKLSDEEKSTYREMRNARPGTLYSRYYDDGDMMQKIGPNAIVQEATSANYPDILSTSITRRVVQVYDEVPDQSDDLVTVVDDIQTFKDQDRILYGGFSDVALVPESDSQNYPYLKGFDEKQSTYRLNKYGGLFAITWEMILNDDLGVFRNLTDELGRLCRHKKKMFIYSLVTASSGGAVNTDQTYDGLALYHANHANVGSAALSKLSLTAARVVIRNQRRFSRSITLGAAYTAGETALTVSDTTGINLGNFIQVDSEFFRVTGVTSGTVLAVTGARMGTAAANHANAAVATLIADTISVNRFHVVVPSEQEDNLYGILNSEQIPGTANNDANQMEALAAKGNLVPHVVDSLYLAGDVRSWYCVAEPTQVKTFEFAYLRGQRKPLIGVQDAELLGNMFMRDNATYKVRFPLGGKAIDWRGAYSSQVAGG